MAVGAGMVWLSLAIGLGLVLGRMVRNADLEEGTADPPVDMPLLGVVSPR